MPTTNLNNITITKREDKNSNTYYLIVNNDNPEEAFFCFEKAVKDGWQDLVNNYQNIKEVELEYEVNDRGNKKVINLYAVTGEIIV